MLKWRIAFWFVLPHLTSTFKSLLFSSPFVGNTLGHDNYKYFISLLFVHIVAGTLWQITAIYSYRRVGASMMMTMFMVYSGIWMVLILSLFNYHLYLLSINVTTNEQINKKKYGYFWWRSNCWPLTPTLSPKLGRGSIHAVVASWRPAPSTRLRGEGWGEGLTK